ncbi:MULTISPECIES: DUF1024 family protein [Staphylococcus]|uniref:DUF1024 family protein n=1 Tax=Staphylococcus TaxID=1279 RepID=UPI0009907BB3|nr:MULTISPECIES: DUF1024 family protein [Staphylococcus]MDW3894471.1 DUF1024 family protein [Staphylococcus saprophyticus]OOO71645.1 hypothetical protein B0W56_06825 [Staphylococcus saprophyticus]
MAYKDMVLGQLTQTAIDERDSTYFEMAKEVEEVYRKAKAFDKVLELHSQHIDTSSIYGSDLPLYARRYEYYDDGLFAYEMYALIKNYLEDE